MSSISGEKSKLCGGTRRKEKKGRTLVMAGRGAGNAPARSG